MSSLPTGHVGDLGAALVDDQLNPAMREMVLRHMVGCVMCRHDVEEQRQLKARLSALGEPGLPLSLLWRLTDLNRSSGLLAGYGGLTPSSPPPSESASFDSASFDSAEAVSPDLGLVDEAGMVALLPSPLHSSPTPTPTPSASPSPSPSPALTSAAPHRGRRLILGAASFLLVGVGTAYATPGGGQPGSPAQPAANVLTTRSASEITGSVPLNDPAFTTMTASFGR